METLRPKRLRDPFFGEMVFMRMPEGVHSYWEARVRFEPTGTEVECGVEADEAGPGDAQKQLYHAISARYAGLLPAITPLLERERQQIQQEFAYDPAGTFRLLGFSVPEAESDTMEWEMDFDFGDEDTWLFTVHMRGWQPTGDVSVAD